MRAQATTNCSPAALVVISGGDTALEKREHARKKSNGMIPVPCVRRSTAVRKKFDKVDRAIDAEDACLKKLGCYRVLGTQYTALP